MKRDWLGVAAAAAVVVFIIGVVAMAATFTIRDDHARSDCLNGGGQIVQATHGGDGWVCIRDGRPLP